MEKGTVYYLSNSVCFKSITVEKDFNEECRDDLVVNLNKAFSIKKFKNFIREFLGKEERSAEWIENFKFYDFCSEEEFVVDFSVDYFKRFPHGWTFFKNMTGIPIRFITGDCDAFEIIIEHGESFRFYYGCLENNQFWYYPLKVCS